MSRLRDAKDQISFDFSNWTYFKHSLVLVVYATFEKFAYSLISKFQISDKENSLKAEIWFIYWWDICD